MRIEKNKDNGKVADIARLDFHDWFGRMFDRTRAKTTEKYKGVLMIEKIRDRFGITQLEEETMKNQIREKCIEDIEEMKREIKWNKDNKGNIVSPFKSNFQRGRR